MAEQSAKGPLSALAGGIFAEVRNLALETADLLRQISGSSRKAGQIGSLLIAGAGTALVGVLLLCLALVHILALAIQDQPIWVSYAVIGFPVLGIGVALLAAGRRRVRSLQAQSAKVMRDATDTVEHAGQSLHDTAESVRDALDLNEQFKKRPWALMAGAASLGYLGGALIHEAGSPKRASNSRQSSGGSADDSGALSRLVHQLEPELTQLKGLALGALFGIVRDSVAKSASQPVERELVEIINVISVKLGGTPIHGQDLRESSGHSDISEARQRHEAP